MKIKKKPKDFRLDVKQSFIEEKHKGRILRLQVVHWVVDGRDHGPSLELRQYHITKDGSERMGRAKGFKKVHADFIAENWDEIKSMYFN